jgi:hypothetical protein
MAFEVLRTAAAGRVVDRDMDKRARASYDAARDDLRGRGCPAGGYRMMAADGDDYPLCGRHLAFDWRAYTAYLDDGRIVIVAVDRHSEIHDPVVGLSELLPGLSKVGRRSKDKPPCCKQPDNPPVMNDELRDLLAAL